MNQEVKTINGYSVKDEKAVRTYDTVALMKADRNLKKGQHVKTRGYFNINDGEGANYYITDTQSQSNYQENLENGLYATLLNNFENNFYDEINFTQERYYDTDCYFTTIPLNDKDNEQIDLVVEHKDYTKQSPLKHAQDNNTSFTINASCYISNTNDSSKSGIPCMIGNGEILRNIDMSGESGVADNYLYVGIKENRDIVDFKVNETSPEQLLASGCKNVFDCYYKLIENYQPLDLTNVVTNESGVVTGNHPRQVLCEMDDKSILILTCDGRFGESKGLTSEQMQEILIEKGVKNAWNLDGGGSTSTEIKTVKINRNFDDSYITDRNIPYTLNVKKIIKNKNVADIYSFISKMNHFFNKRYQEERFRPHNISNEDVDNLIGNLIVGYGTSVVNTPVASCYFINIVNSSNNENRYLYNKQICFDMISQKIYTRQMRQGVWSVWSLTSNPLSQINFNSFTVPNTGYQEITLGSVVNLDSTSIIKNDDNSFSFNEVGNKLLYFEGRVKGSSGNKFIRLTKNDTEVYTQANHNESTAYNQIILISHISISSPNDKFKLLINANVDDVLEQIRVYIK